MLGGFYGVFDRVSNWIMKRFKGFHLNNGLANKLYSYKEKDESLDMETVVTDKSGSAEDYKQRKIRAALLKDVSTRKPITAKYFDWYFQSSCFWKYLCCRCNRKPSRAEKLFADAQKKLNVEMDVLEIIKINRIARAFFTAKTTPKERELVKFFDDYTLHSGDDQSQNYADSDIFDDEDLV